MTASSEQIEMLLNYLSEHTDLARGHLRSVEGRLRSNQLWQQITTDLNSLGGCIKTVKQWQKVWADRKYLTKKAAAAAKKSASATGGGPSSAPQITDMDAQVIQIMGEGFGEPQTDARVPAFPQDQSQQIELFEVPSSVENIESHLMTTSDEPPVQLEVPPAVQLSGPSSMSSQPAGDTQATVSQPSRHGRVRRGTSQAVEQGVRTRFFNMEEQRVSADAIRAEQLSLIRESLAELCSIAREFLVEYRARNN